MVEESHKIYIPLFQTFECKKETKAPAILLDNKKQKIIAKQWVKYIAGIAALCLLAIGIGYLFQPKNNDTYAIIHGKRINDKEVVYAHAEAQMLRSMKIIEKSFGNNFNNPEIQQQLEKIKKEITLTD